MARSLLATIALCIGLIAPSCGGSTGEFLDLVEFE